MSKKYNPYLGQSGHLLVMSELLYRGWNVAIPQVDKGEDIFVVEDGKDGIKAIQVKTTIGKGDKDKFSAGFNLRSDQFNAPDNPPLHYVFVVRHLDKWQKFFIIKRSDFVDKFVDNGIAYSTSKKTFRLVFSYSKEGEVIKCRKIDFSYCLNNWVNFNEITH
ncbi:MAG TPA: hypothetical protein VN026_03900 [Bacteroidia bacterium]|jgi:hypothetical protein|nr:hypothetical protein [Bacteroidia bacterium]